MNELDEQFYERAAAEVAAKDIAPGIMAKCLVDADGDEKKAVAYYIRRRVEQLKTQHAERERKDMLEKRQRLWTRCKSCGLEGSMEQSFIPPPDHRLFATAVRCTKCGNRFDWYYVPGENADTD